MKSPKRRWPGAVTDTKATFPRPAETGRDAAPRPSAPSAEPAGSVDTPADDEPEAGQQTAAPPAQEGQPAQEVPSQGVQLGRSAQENPQAAGNPPASQTAPRIPPTPQEATADLPTAAPTIGRVGPATVGVLGTDCRLRPPAVAVDGTTAGIFHVAAASIIGTGHLQAGQPRQDGYSLMQGRSGRLYVAIADGLGSRPVSQLGAHLFTESVLIVAAESESDAGSPATAAQLLAQGSARTARVVTEAYQLEVKDASCVGAVAVFSAQQCDVARVGDVAAFTLAGGEFAEVFPVDSRFINVVSATLPGEEPPQVDTVELGPADILVLGTDGLANDLRNSAALRSWLAARWRVPQWPFAMVDTLRYRRQGSHDDRTAVVVWRTAAVPATAEPKLGTARDEASDGAG